MQPPLPCYAPSGAFKPIIVVHLLGWMIVAVALAGLYELLIHFIPFIYLNLLLAVGFGFALGIAALGAVEAAHCRNRFVALVVALLLGGGGLAASYGWGYRRALSQLSSKNPGTTLPQAAQELGFGAWLQDRIDGGWYLKKNPITGAGVLAVWGIEAVIVLGIVLVATVGKAGDPYCERCRQWTRSQTARLPGVSRDNVQPLLDRGDLAGVLSLTSGLESDSTTMLLERRSCPQCGESAYLSMTETRLEVKKDKATTVRTHLLTHAALTPELNAMYVQHFGPLLASAPPARDSME
jgi:hypothetical protein